LTQIKVYQRREWERKANPQEAFMSITFLIAAVACIFGTFAAALLYAEISTRGIIAPGGRRLD
jgi:heme/copper-type cytochrome/quinol oxidase subunit 3